MNFIDATTSYEAWLAKELRILPEDLEQKHQLMAESPFPFLRATYYRWAQIWAETAEGLAKTPVVLAVGDLHVENFGTWRDAEGRLVWGVNDFDETAPLPMAIDLTRLAVSVFLASEHHSLGRPARRWRAAFWRATATPWRAAAGRSCSRKRHPALRQIARERLKDEERVLEEAFGVAGVQGTQAQDRRCA